VGGTTFTFVTESMCQTRAGAGDRELAITGGDEARASTVVF